MHNYKNAKTLVDLQAMILSDRHTARYDEEVREELQAVDYSSLPTFGGAEPADTRGVWSWDESNLLLGDDFQIVPREEVS